MKRVNYNEIAKIFDDNPERTETIQIDGDLINIISRSEKNTLKILYVACGTGIYLGYHQLFFSENQVLLYGIDESEEMIRIVRNKLPNAELKLSMAESLPYAEDTFDCVYCSFAFHHFSDKPKALEEMTRVLKPHGLLKIVTISPEF